MGEGVRGDGSDWMRGDERGCELGPGDGWVGGMMGGCEGCWECVRGAWE